MGQNICRHVSRAFLSTLLKTSTSQTYKDTDIDRDALRPSRHARHSRNDLSDHNQPSDLMIVIVVAGLLLAHYLSPKPFNSYSYIVLEKREFGRA